MGRGKHESLLPNRLGWGLRVSLVDRLRRQSRRPGGFFALGYGGQFAFVIPAYDLVVVHRHDEEHGPNLRQMGRLLRRRRANRSTVARSSNSSPVRRCDMAMVPPADPTESDWTMMAVRRRCVDQTASSSIRESGVSKAIAYAEIGKRPNRCMRAGRPSTRASMLLSSMATA